MWIPRTSCVNAETFGTQGPWLMGHISPGVAQRPGHQPHFVGMLLKEGRAQESVCGVSVGGAARV